VFYAISGYLITTLILQEIKVTGTFNVRYFLSGAFFDCCHRSFLFYSDHFLCILRKKIFKIQEEFQINQ